MVVRPVGTEIVPVATFANVLAPEKYGMFPMTADVEVERPFQPIAPVPLLYEMGKVAERSDRSMKLVSLLSSESLIEDEATLLSMPEPM